MCKAIAVTLRCAFAPDAVDLLTSRHRVKLADIGGVGMSGADVLNEVESEEVDHKHDQGVLTLIPKGPPPTGEEERVDYSPVVEELAGGAESEEQLGPKQGATIGGPKVKPQEPAGLEVSWDELDS